MEEHPIADDDAPLPRPVYAETDMSSPHLDRVVEDILKTVSDSARTLDPSLAYVVTTPGDMPVFLDRPRDLSPPCGNSSITSNIPEEHTLLTDNTTIDESMKEPLSL